MCVGFVYDDNNLVCNFGFYIFYVNDEIVMVCIGNLGEFFDEVIFEINFFICENLGEFIFFSVCYFIGCYEIFDCGFIYWDV